MHISNFVLAVSIFFAAIAFAEPIAFGEGGIIDAIEKRQTDPCADASRKLLPLALSG